MPRRHSPLITETHVQRIVTVPQEFGFSKSEPGCHLANALLGTFQLGIAPDRRFIQCQVHLLTRLFSERHNIPLAIFLISKQQSKPQPVHDLKSYLTIIQPYLQLIAGLKNSRGLSRSFIGKNGTVFCTANSNKAPLRAQTTLRVVQHEIVLKMSWRQEDPIHGLQRSGELLEIREMKFDLRFDGHYQTPSRT